MAFNEFLQYNCKKIVLKHHFFAKLRETNALFSGAAGKKNRLKERRLMKGFNLSSGGAASGSVSTPLGGGVPGLPGLCSQASNPLPSGAGKKSSLTIAPADIMIDMNAPKKSPMQR